MCELLAMSSHHPATVSLSLEEFAQHGGGSGHHRDGWGIAYYDDGDVRLMREAVAAADSAGVRYIQSNDLRSQLVISHIRKATQGGIALKNTQPFTRELGGRMHVFAHNGQLTGIEDRTHFPLGHCKTIGDTDSEVAFCALLQRMEAIWATEAPPTIAARLAVVARFAAQIAKLGPANFLYGDGTYVFAHGDRRTQSDGTMRAPGLWLLERSCQDGGPAMETSGLTISPHSQPQEVVLIASVPLSEEPWRSVPEGEVIAVSKGGIVARTHRGEHDHD